MNSPKISVIVPVYKAEAYLRRCVDSLLAQTFMDFEVLLIDDGSPDGSGKICDEYARQDNRIRVFHKENGGVSSARQYGLEHVQGEYVIHADPDDWVEITMLKELYMKAVDEDADMVLCDFYIDEKKRTRYALQRPSILDSETVCREMHLHLLHGSCWNKLVRRDCYVRYNIKFPQNLSYCEDLFINTCLLVHQLKISYLPKAFYHYDQHVNTSSIVHKPCKFILEQERLLSHLLSESLSKEQFDILYPYLLRNQAEVILYNSEFPLNNFSHDFRSLKGNLHKIYLSKKLEFIMWIALYISPHWGRSLYEMLRK